MAKKVQLMTNPKQWQVVDDVEVLVQVEQEDIDPMTDSSCVEIEGHRTLEETINEDNAFSPEIVETKVHSKVGGVYHDNVMNGAYEQAILYGNTQVNLVESDTRGIKYIPHSFTSFQGNESKIGNYNSSRTNQVAPLVKGVTLVNLCQETSVSIASEESTIIENVKGDTTYTLSFTFTTKNTEAGITIKSFNGESELEDSRSQTGLDDNAIITFTTHENANTIHIQNNDAYGTETIQLDNIMLIEGDVTDLDLPFFKGMRSVELSRPLTNLFTDDLVHYNQNTSSTNTNGDITVTSISVSSWNNTDYYLKNLKPHTKYIVMWDSLTTTQTTTTQQEILVCAVCVQYNVKLGGINEDVKCPTLRSMIFDTRDKDLSQIVLRIHASMSNSEATSTTIKGLRVFEWDDSLRTLDLQTIGYFSGTKYVSAPRTLETEGKNLYPYGDINFTPVNGQTWHDGKGKAGMTGDIASKSQTRFLLRKGTYTFSFGETVNTTYLALVDDKEQSHGSSKSEERTFTLSQDTYMTLRLKTTEANVATTATNIQIERGETATTYEAYQSRYYKPRETEEIILRSLPNGVCDTFNLQTGELVQNIGEIVLDGVTGVQDWQLDGTNETTAISGFYLGNSITTYNFSIQKNEQYVISDKFKTISSEEWKNRDTEACIDNTGNIAFLISNSKLSEISGDGFRQYLQQNPITVQYKLKEPIITKLQTYDRIYNGQTNGRVDMGNNLSALTYNSNNSYLKVSNLSPVPAIIEPITSIPYDVRLKPSTLYTIKYNRGGNSNSMKFDLGGSVVEKTNLVTDSTGIAEELTVKTPAILSHEQLILSGTGFAHNFIVVEGDITGTELPYFEGMKDVKMPIVKNIGKNLFNPNIIGDSGQYIRNDTGSLVEDLTSKYTVGYICVQPNIKYYLYVKGLQRVYFLDNDKKWISRTNILYQQGTQAYTTNTNFTTGSNCHYIQIQYRVDELDLTNATLVEYGDSNPHVEYKENSIYAVQGEYPITSEMFEQGGMGYSTTDSRSFDECKIDNNTRIRSKECIPIKQDYVYQLYCTGASFQTYFFDATKTSIGFTHGWNTKSLTFTTPTNAKYMSLMFKNDGALSVNAFMQKLTIHMYELDSTISLRSLPNGVKDELNLLTGEYIQRVGEVVFDGSDDEDWNVYTDGDFALTPFFHITFFNWLDGGSCTNKYHNTIKISSDGELGYCIYGNGVSNSIPRAILRVRTNEIVNGLTIESWKEELKISPLILQYELAEPIISHVRLVSNNQEREVGVKLPNGVCNTYNPSTGITTVRVGKMVLDGSEDEAWTTAKDNTGGAFRFETQVLSGKFNGVTNDVEVPVLLCDKYTVYKFHSIYIGSAVGIAFYQSSHIVIYDNKYTDLASFKQALQSNPITIWYELKYPQIQPDIVLPNGVHDEYNPETGVYTKRVGFVEFDGSEDWTAGFPGGELQQAVNGATDMYGVWTAEPLPNAKPASVTNDDDRVAGVCDSFSFKNAPLDETNEEFYFISYTGRFNMNVARTKLTGSNVSHLKAYLSQNPIKLWYELQTPITYQLTPYFGLPQPYAYEDGYLVHDSAYPDTTLPPEFSYKLVTNRTGQIIQNNIKLKQHTTRLSNLEALIIEATIQSLFDRELQLFELELMDIQLIDLGE